MNSKLSQRRFKKLIGITLIGLGFNLLLHLTVFPLNLPKNFPASIWVKKDLVPAVAGPAMALTLFLLALVYSWLQPRLPGSRWRQGGTFAAAFCGLWLLGFVEGTSLFGTTVLTEFINALPDLLTIGLLGVLLSLWLAEDSPKNKWNWHWPGLAIVASTFFLWRYLTARFLGGTPLFQFETHLNPAWLAAMAVWLAAFYGMLGGAARGKTACQRAAYFCLVILGIDWLLFQLFIVVFFDLPAWPFAFRAIADLLYLFPGVWSAERLRERSHG